MNKNRITKDYIINSIKNYLACDIINSSKIRFKEHNIKLLTMIFELEEKRLNKLYLQETFKEEQLNLWEQLN